MTYTHIHYAQALAAALKGKSAAEQKQIAARLFRRLTRARALKERGRIVRETSRIMRRQEGIIAAEVHSAAPLSAEKRRAIKLALGKKALITQTINPHLLAGVRILINEDILIDATARRRLTALFSHAS